MISGGMAGYCTQQGMLCVALAVRDSRSLRNTDYELLTELHVICAIQTTNYSQNYLFRGYVGSLIEKLIVMLPDGFPGLGKEINSLPDMV